jgi:predicted nucleotidyltransferase
MERDMASLERLRAALAPHEEVWLALAFGSRARGDHEASSDLDVAVLGPVDAIGLSAELSLALGIDVDVVLLEGASVPLLRAVLRDAVCVREGRPGAWGAFLSAALTDLDTDGPTFDRMHDAFVRRVAQRGLPVE